MYLIINNLSNLLQMLQMLQEKRYTRERKFFFFIKQVKKRINKA